MIGKETIEKNINEYLKMHSELFLVCIKTTPDNRIKVFVDGFEGVSVEACIKLSRYLESKFDRNIEDFSLEVSSAGLGTPFQVLEQYQKALNKEVEVKLKDGIKIFGELKEITKEGILVKKNIVGKKENAESCETLSFDDILTTKEVITF